MAFVLFRENENRDITGGMGAMDMNEPEEGYNRPHSHRLQNLICLTSFHT